MATSQTPVLGSSPVLRNVLIATAAAVGYGVSGQASYALALMGGPVVLLWAPAGLMLGALLLLPRLWWPLLAGGVLGCFALEAVHTGNLAFAVLAAFANNLESLFAAWVVSRLVPLPLTLTTLREVTALLLGGAVVANGVTALLGALLLKTFSNMTFVLGWIVWWTGDGLGIIVLAPVVIAWAQWRSLVPFLKGKRAEAILLATGLILTCELIFDWQSLFGTTILPRPYLTLPFLYWAAFRFGPLGAVSGAFLIAGEALWHSAASMGPFVGIAATRADRVVDAYLFLSLATVTGLIMAAVLAERHAAEGSLREAEARTRTIVENAPEAIVVVDMELDGFVDVNSNAEKMFGRSREELLRLRLGSLSPPTQPDGRPSLEAGLRYIQEALAGATPVFEWTLLGAQGHDILTEVRLVRLPSSRPVVRGSITDITARRRMEEDLRQSQKLEAVGRLAGGIAHDFNNLLTVISGYTEILLSQFRPSSAVWSQVREIRDAAERGAGLTRQLLSFSRRQMTRDEVVDVNALLRQMEHLLRRVIGEHIQWKATFPTHPVFVRVDPHQFEQVVMNLVINARDAMPDGGRMNLEARTLELAEEDAPSAGLAPGTYVVLSISDTGHGMDADTQARIFEPFFTTKELGKGTGLGLATAYGIVQRSNGHIVVRSEPEKGTTFDVYLPVAPPAPLPDEDEEVGTAPGGTETILFVEDEKPLRLVVANYLEERGYTVFAAANGRDALALEKQCEDPIHLLVTDVVMPEIGGPELANAFALARPETRVLFLSGYVKEEYERPGREQHELLAKPFSLPELARRIRGVLDRAEPGPSQQSRTLP